MTHINSATGSLRHDVFAKGDIPTVLESETDDLTQALLPRLSRLHGTRHGGRFSRLEFPGLGASPFLVLSGKAVMTTGTVKWINERKGFGLVTPDSGGKDLFARFWAP